MEAQRLARHRYRTNKIKRMHGIIHNLLPVLTAMATHPAITQINPGRISGNRRAGDHNITVQYFTDSGLKLLARSPSSIQEVFIVTAKPEEVKSWLLEQGLVTEMGSQERSPNSSSDGQALNRNTSRPKSTKRQRPRKKSSTNGVSHSYGQSARTPSVADRLPDDTLRRLRQLATTNGAKKVRTANNPRQRPPTTAPPSKDKASQSMNPLEAWLEQTDDETLRRLARKSKGPED